LVVSIVYELLRRSRTACDTTGGEVGRYGVVSMCVGTGMGAAAVLEVEPSSSL